MTTYDNHMAYVNSVYEKQMKGKLLIKGSERPWEMTKQAQLKFFLQPNTFTDNALQEWYLFISNIRTHTGLHKHQGGICIFILEGKGYTIVDGERWDWEAGDLIVLPLKPGGVDHQHFNPTPDTPCKWMAFLYMPYRFATVTELEQKELDPQYKP